MNTVAPYNPSINYSDLLTPEGYRTEWVHIGTIHRYDTVYHDGKTRTVGTGLVAGAGSDSTTLWGDSYHGGRKLVLKVHVGCDCCRMHKAEVLDLACFKVL